MAIRRKRQPEHYVNNKDFTAAVVAYVERKGETPLPDYIAICFMKMAEGLSHLPNFYLYSYRQDMVMDAVENCIRAIQNYDYKAKTRSGNPNAFGYFNQIMYFAFLRRIAKEKRQQEIKERVIENATVEYFLDNSSDIDANTIVERIRTRREKY